MSKDVIVYLDITCGPVISYVYLCFMLSVVIDRSRLVRVCFCAGHTQCVQLLLRCGSSVCVHDMVLQQTPVHLAARAGNLECLSLLLDNAENMAVVDTPDAHKRYEKGF
jgi:hypothetical protein